MVEWYYVHSCQCTKRRWKKDQLQVSLHIIRKSLLEYQIAMLGNPQFLSNFVLNNSHIPHFLFSTLPSLINPCDCTCIVPWLAHFEKILTVLKKRFLRWGIFSLVLFGPCIVDVINSSLMSGCVRTAFRHAVVQPLHQKDEFDFSIPSNFKPISKFPFLSKKKRKEQKNQLVTNYSSSSI